MRERVESVIRELAAEYMARESNRQSLVTVTRASIADTGHTATVYITVLPDERETAALAFANRKRNDFWLFLKEHSRLKVLPTVRFALDKGEKNRQNLDTLSKE